MLGTGTVGRTIAAKLAEIGHGPVIGSRDPVAALAVTERARPDVETLGEWHAQNEAIPVATFSDAAAHGEALVNATNGAGSLSALELAGAANLAGKVLIDISNPLDFSKGFPPTLFVANDDSLGEQIQRSFLGLKVVKTLNTVTASVMVDPGSLTGGDHTLFLSGDDPGAKEQVTTWLRGWFGWRDVIDLGDITTARGVEMYLPLWVRLLGALGSPKLNVRVVR